MPSEISALQHARYDYAPKRPAALQGGANVSLEEKETALPDEDQSRIQSLFPNTYGLPILTCGAANNGDGSPQNVGVILSGGQAPGGHNVIAGLFDGLKSVNPASRLFGFRGGPSGLIDNNYLELTDDVVAPYRNTGGFDIIGSGRTKLETQDQFDVVLKNCKALDINALVIIGGDDSNTNAGVLAEYYRSIDAGIQVIGCPKTIDGDLKNDYIEASFGTDTACKVYSELVGNIARDALSARKYWHFIKLMGRSASHITLECALQTQPNIALMSEEIEAQGQTLDDIVNDICQRVIARSEAGLNFGIILIPEGLIEFIPAIKALIAELNDRLAHQADLADALASATSVDALVELGLTANSAAAYYSLPGAIREQLVLDRDPHGNVQVSRIETEKLLIAKVEERLGELKAAGEYQGKFSAQNHFLGYEGRCAPPSNFDADYCYSLGYTAASLIAGGKYGYIATVRNLTAPAEQWVPGGVPVTSLMNIERRHGEDKPVIRKALVELDDGPFKAFAAQRERWAIESAYLFPGPIQYFGPSEVTDQSTKTLQLEAGA